MLIAGDVVDDFPCGLLNGLVSCIDDLPVLVFLDEVPNILDLGEDFSQVAVTRLQTGIFLTHLPDFLEDLGVYIETDYFVLVDFEELFRQWDSRNNGNICDLVALLGKV